MLRAAHSAPSTFIAELKRSADFGLGRERNLGVGVTWIKRGLGFGNTHKLSVGVEFGINLAVAKMRKRKVGLRRELRLVKRMVSVF